MSSPEFERDASAQPQHEEPVQADSGDQTPPDPKLLEQVLQETVSAASSGEPIAPEQLQALAEVAGRHAGKASTLDAVAAELVEAILRKRFEKLDQSNRSWREMSSQIAETLLEDTPSRDRFEQLWERLSKAAG